jgi:hypothetical protein
MGSGQANRLVQFSRSAPIIPLGWGARRRLCLAGSMVLCPSHARPWGRAVYHDGRSLSYERELSRLSSRHVLLSARAGRGKHDELQTLPPVKLAAGERMMCAKSHGSRCAVSEFYTS